MDYSHSHHVQLLKSRFRYAHRKMVGGRARLFGDRIELSGWTLRGRHRRCIPLDEIADLEYHLLQDDANLTLVLTGDEVLHLHIQEAHRWREMFENWLKYSVLPSARLLGGREAASDLAG